MNISRRDLLKFAGLSAAAAAVTGCTAAAGAAPSAQGGSSKMLGKTSSRCYRWWMGRFDRCQRIEKN